MDSPPEEEFARSEEYISGPSFSSRFSNLFSQRGPLVIAIGATAASLILVCLFAYLLIRSDEADEPTPTTTIAEQIDRDTDVFPYQAISDSGAISHTLETPIFLDIANTQFNVQPVRLPAAGVWFPSIENETNTAWVYGSIINYIFALENSRENQDLLEGLDEGDELVLTTRSGKKSTFSVTRRQELEGDNREIFAQRAPGITILLVEEDPETPRLVVQGRYVLSDSKDDFQTAQVVEMGQTAQLETLQFTVTGAATQYDRPEAPSGFAIFQIDYQVQNVGSAAFNASSLSMVLADDLGNLYALNPTASQLGNNPPLAGSISQGQTVLATAGFQVPVGLKSAFLHWRVALAGTGTTIQIDVPFQDPLTLGSQASIVIQEVTISPDGGSILIAGELANQGPQLILVDVNEVSLSSNNGTIYQTLSTNPAFPWSVPPGQAIPFGVTFQRPLGADAIFTIHGQSFQITGLR